MNKKKHNKYIDLLIVFCSICLFCLFFFLIFYCTDNLTLAKTENTSSNKQFPTKKKERDYFQTVEITKLIDYTVSKKKTMKKIILFFSKKLKHQIEQTKKNLKLFDKHDKIYKEPLNKHNKTYNYVRHKRKLKKNKKKLRVIWQYNKTFKKRNKKNQKKFTTKKELFDNITEYLKKEIKKWKEKTQEAKEIKLSYLAKNNLILNVPGPFRNTPEEYEHFKTIININNIITIEKKDVVQEIEINQIEDITNMLYYSIIVSKIIKENKQDQTLDETTIKKKNVIIQCLYEMFLFDLDKKTQKTIQKNLIAEHLPTLDVSFDFFDAYYHLLIEETPKLP